MLRTIIATALALSLGFAVLGCEGKGAKTQENAPKDAGTAPASTSKPAAKKAEGAVNGAVKATKKAGNDAMKAGKKAGDSAVKATNKLGKDATKATGDALKGAGIGGK